MTPKVSLVKCPASVEYCIVPDRDTGPQKDDCRDFSSSFLAGKWKAGLGWLKSGRMPAGLQWSFSFLLPCRTGSLQGCTSLSGSLHGLWMAHSHDHR